MAKDGYPSDYVKIDDALLDSEAKALQWIGGPSNATQICNFVDARLRSYAQLCNDWNGDLEGHKTCYLRLVHAYAMIRGKELVREMKDVLVRDFEATLRVDTQQGRHDSTGQAQGYQGDIQSYLCPSIRT